MQTATARHILVNDESRCLDLKEQIDSGKTSFEEVARDHSLCPSGVKGGELGSFGQGDMVAEFDKVVFNDEVGVVHGPIKTQFGYHLLEVTQRD